MIMNTSGNLSENHEVKIISISDGNWSNNWTPILCTLSFDQTNLLKVCLLFSVPSSLV